MSGMDENHENTSGEGNGRETDHLTSVLSVTTQDVVSRKEKLAKSGQG